MRTWLWLSETIWVILLANSLRYLWCRIYTGTCLCTVIQFAGNYFQKPKPLLFCLYVFLEHMLSRWNLFIQDILNSHGNFLTFQSKFNIKINYLHYFVGLEYLPSLMKIPTTKKTLKAKDSRTVDCGLISPTVRRLNKGIQQTLHFETLQLQRNWWDRHVYSFVGDNGKLINMHNRLALACNAMPRMQCIFLWNVEIDRKLIMTTKTKNKATYGGKRYFAFKI